MRVAIPCILRVVYTGAATVEAAADVAIPCILRVVYTAGNVRTYARIVAIPCILRVVYTLTGTNGVTARFLRRYGAKKNGCSMPVAAIIRPFSGARL